MTKPFFDDGTFKVSSAGVSTPYRYYPLANTAASIRRDPLWIGLLIAVFAIGSLLVYGDLFYLAELVVIGCVGIVSLVVGVRFSVLRLDAPGQRRAYFFGDHEAIKKRLAAICLARIPDAEGISIVE